MKIELRDGIVADGIFTFAVEDREHERHHHEEETPRRERRHKGEPHDPEDLIPEDDPFAGLADAPPPISGYRDANVQGMACWNCAHFTIVGQPDQDGQCEGVCNLFEAKAEGKCTCDRFTAHADLWRHSPHTSWQEDMANESEDRRRYGASVMEGDFSDRSILNYLHFAGEAREEDGLIWKDILRTGEWDKTPTIKGVINKHLQILKDGESDPENGIISLSEIERHFNEGAVPYVTIPLSDDKEDHKNIARLNTGFVRRVRLVDRDGLTVLQAGMDFTEPDVRGKVLRGTIPDVSACIPFNVVRRDDNRLFKTVLDHVCLTRKPFVSKLVPFGIAAADGDELPVEAWEMETDEPASEPRTSSSQQGNGSPSPEFEIPPLSFKAQIAAIRAAFSTQLQLGPEYRVEDIAGDIAIISHSTSQCKWEAKFRMTGQKDFPIQVANPNSWKLIESPPDEEEEEVAASNSPKRDELQRARELRELRLSQPTSQTGGIQMSALSLDGLELSDLPETARARIQSILKENQTLRTQGRTTSVDQRIEQLKGLEGLNLSDRPGALKFYRQVMLDDDGGAACVLFSDDDDEEKKERLTATEILDRFIAGLQADPGVQLSDMALASANDKKPPKDASREGRPLEDRVKDAQTALYGKRNRRK